MSNPNRQRRRPGAAETHAIQLRALQQHLANLASAREAAPPPTPTPTPAPAPMLPCRKALPFNHIFGGDETMFKSWHRAIISKLRSYSAFIGNHERQ
ncbi:hypothetical protein E4U60_000488 [Claviceps pazoutovae]|uniref:Uncharacterized protein n=1 Tax=Claviceps pazoutovae TaxID=1649127 RepID=A0A9P7MER9_9HYPO|nr:hypothetical protein E4U60_000488 [Claviceps pazoutovae]